MNVRSVVTADPIAAMVESGLCPIITDAAWLKAVAEQPGKFAHAMGIEVHTVEIANRSAEAIPLFIELAPRLVEAGMMPGIGSITGNKQLPYALEITQRFIVGPNFSESLAGRIKNTSPYIPGVRTPTEFVTAYEAGCRLLKFFPGEGHQADLKETLGALSYSLPGMEVVVSGLRDFSEQALKSWFQAGAKVITVGSAVFTKDCAGDWNHLQLNMLRMREKIENARA